MARPFTVIGFTMFFTLALVFELGQKAAVVILSAAAAAFIFSLFFKSVRRDFVYNGGRCSTFVFCRRTCS